MSSKQILIYNDEGASQECVNALLAYFKNSKCISGEDLQKNNWIHSTRLLIMPGGRSLPFYKKLTEIGNQYIKLFVEQGGCYVGLCAGAYYASTKTVFAEGTPLALTLPGELHFFQGRAIGPVFTDKPFEYNSESGAQNVDIRFEDQKKYSVYFNGGCYFENAEAFANTHILARYEKNNLPAIIACQIGKGRAVLSGVHPELSGNQAQIILSSL